MCIRTFGSSYTFNVHLSTYFTNRTVKRVSQQKQQEQRHNKADLEQAWVKT